MISCYIVDDEKNNIKLLEKIINEFCPHFKVIGNSTDVVVAFNQINHLKPDLVFLDVVMPLGDSFGLLDRLLPLNFEVIMVTAHEKYAFKAISYDVLGYLLKPVNIKELQDLAQKAIYKISNKKSVENLNILVSGINNSKLIHPNIAVPTIEGLLFFDLENIIRIEAGGSYSNIFTTDRKKIMSSKNIKEFEEILPKNKFFRVHNSHIININKLSKYEKGRGGFVILEDGTKIEVASRRKIDFLNLFK
jgi:two-component system LytT family response regulator